jgi:ATP-dependent Zn protease
MGADMGRFSKQEAVAYHEAGHAVMAYHRQRGMKYATIEAAERGGGIFSTPRHQDFALTGKIKTRESKTRY